ncbi:efflux transporter outer membrane subunit [Gallaecimonas mangrovi]|uniref:efflux transporter outer membrane subunit n=1 Tax=Gallaecimonas mangrovi TaxID=2291597 RepID=UPI000E201A06|nr:efflux transporter outer membrane subunit [Gallaecimonas mangrovi]
MIKPSLVALAVSALLAGCVTAPKDAQTMVAPLDADQLGLSTTATMPAAASNQWWTAFSDPQLNALVQQAMLHSPNLESALANLRSAQAQAGEAMSATGPDISLSASETRQKLSGTYTIPPPYGGHTYWIGSATVNLGWDLDFWGKQKSLVESANNRVQAAALDHAAAQLAVSGSVTRAYLELCRAQALLNIAKQQQQQRQQQLAITEARVKAGLDTELALRNAQALLPQAKAAVIAAKNSQQLAVHQLAALTGQGVAAYKSLGKTTANLKAALPVPSSLPIGLLARRPDILAAKARVEADKAAAKAAHAAFYPDISLSALVGVQSVELSKMLSSDSLTYGAGPALSLPLFDAGRLRANYRGSIAAEDAAIAAYNQAVLTAVQQSSDQLSNIEAIKAQRQQWQQSLVAAKAALDLAKHNYQAGIISQLQVLDVENRWLDAERSIANFNVDLALARVNLLLAIGGSFDPQLFHSTATSGVSS